MFAVRLHGRGGQGIVTTAELLAVAAFEEGRHAQAFPTFGSERTGAPVAAYVRLDDRQIRTHAPIAAPDALIVADATLFRQVDVLAGGKEGGVVLVNAGSPAEVPPGVAAIAVPASRLAMTHVGRNAPGVVLLGAFAAVTGQVSLSALTSAIRLRFRGTVAEGNVAAARAGFEHAKELAHA
jgi:pyruvate ferredoxin oxidoreductase gamma subunit